MDGTHYDVIVIGTGAGGGTLARRLAPSGKRVLLLERGDYLPSEQANWDRTEVWINRRYVSRERWTTTGGMALEPNVYYHVGGATKMYGAALFRLRREDFGEVAHAGGTSPAWPIGYDELEPFYSEAERLYRVHGERGADPTEPAASSPYPFPPVAHEPPVAALHQALEGAGYHPFPLPIAVMLDEQDGSASPCIRCGTCDGHPCMVDAKSDAEVIGVRPALAHSNVTLMTNSRVVRLETSASGREVTAVLVERGDRVERLRGDVVVLCAGACNSAKLLLASSNHRHPTGLANRSGQVGRNLMMHNMMALIVLSIRENPTRFQKTLALNDFYFGADDSGYPGGNVQLLGKTRGEVYRQAVPRIVPLSLLDRLLRHAFDIFLTAEDLPDPDNRVTLSSTGSIALRYRPNNLEAMRRLHARMRSALHEIGRDKRSIGRSLTFTYPVPLAAAIGHQAGTCRLGADPATSVLDTTCKAHELDNLYLADASVFPSIGAVNPSLTIMANALRVADRVLERLQ